MLTTPMTRPSFNDARMCGMRKSRPHRHNRPPGFKRRPHVGDEFAVIGFRPRHVIPSTSPAWAGSDGPKLSARAPDFQARPHVRDETTFTPRSRSGLTNFNVAPHVRDEGAPPKPTISTSSSLQRRPHGRDGTPRVGPAVLRHTNASTPACAAWSNRCSTRGLLTETNADAMLVASTIDTKIASASWITTRGPFLARELTRWIFSLALVDCSSPSVRCHHLRERASSPSMVNWTRAVAGCSSTKEGIT